MSAKKLVKKQRVKRSTKRHGESAAPEERVLVLRTVSPDGVSHGGFVHPLTVGAPVEAPDWNTTEKCGGGIHGALWGEGDGSLFSWEAETLWQVYSVNTADGLVNLNGKVKFRRGTLVYIGDRLGATEYVAQNGGAGRKIIGGTATAGDGGTATAGDGGTATAGDGGTATAGDRGTATAGHGGTANAGDRGTANAGDRGTATAGYGGTATAGYGGTANAGDRGTANAGDRGTATAGYEGTATAGNRGTATAGDGGAISILWYDHSRDRHRRLCAEIGENGIKPNTKYRVNEHGKFEEAEDRSGR